jgi:WD40 repeat protein
VTDETRKLNVFLSYSRDDLAFADQLVAALRAAGFDPTIDRTMPGGEEWEKRLAAFIRDADSVVFLLSPSSVSSKWCRWEVDQAAERGKRILPALCRPLEGASPPPQLAALNYIYFYPEPKSPGSDWGTGIERLASALRTNLGWLREHTRYLQRAEEWDAGRRAANRLLSGPDIDLAKAWASSRPANAPEPTELQRDFIKASEAEEIRQQSAETQRLKEIDEAQAERAKALAEREEAQKRAATALAEGKEAQEREAKALAERKEAQKRFAWAAIAGFVVAMGLLAAAGWQYSNAKAQSKIAQQESEAAKQASLEAQKNAARAAANDERAAANLRVAQKAREDAETAKRDALEARDRLHVTESQSLAALADLKRQSGDPTTAALLALEGLPSPGNTRPYTPEPEAALYSALYNSRERATAPADGRQSMTIDTGGATRSIDLLRGGVRLGKRDFSAASNRRVKPGQDSSQLLLFDTSKEAGGSGDVLLKDLGTYEADPEWGRTSATFSPDGTRLLASGEKGVIWNALTGVRIAELKGYEWPAAAAFSANNAILATTATLYDATNVELWNPQTGQQIKSFPAGHSDIIKDVALSPDGKTLATCADDQSCRIWAVPEARLVTTLARLPSNTNPTFSPDGSLFFVGSRPISIWDAKTWQLVDSIGLDGVDIYPDMLTSDGSFMVTRDNKETLIQIWDLRSSGASGIVQTLRRPDGTPLHDQPLGLRLAADDTVLLSLPDESKPGETHGVRFSAKTGAELGPTGKINCGDIRATGDCDPFGDGYVDVSPFFNGFDEVDEKSYRKELPHQLVIDAEITTAGDASTRMQAKIDLETVNPADIQRLLIDAQRKLIAAELSGNRLLLGAWNADRFASETNLGEDTFGWFVIPNEERLGLVSLRRLMIADMKGRPIAKFDGKSISSGAGLTLINNNADFSEIVAHDGSRTRVFKLYPDYQSVSEAARNEAPRCLTIEQRATYGLSPEPPDWCVDTGKWPFDTPEWKTWLSKRKQDPTTPLPAR